MNVVFQMVRRGLLSVGIAGMVASTLRAVGFDATTEVETGGWRDLTSDDLIAPRLLPAPTTVDLTSYVTETV